MGGGCRSRFSPASSRCHAVRAAARPRLPLCALERRGGAARPARHGAARRRREHSVHPRLHRRLRRARRRRGGDRQGAVAATAQAESPASSSSCSGSRSSGSCPCRSACSRRACSRARGGAARARCSAGRSPSARRRASASCSPPCSSSRADTGTVLKGTALLAAYALGLGAAFIVAGLAFARAMGAFRWLRDRYTLIQVASGMMLVALGLLLFFHRDWWLHVALNRALDRPRAHEALRPRRTVRPGRSEPSRSVRRPPARRLHLREHARDVDAAMRRRERREPPRRLLELPPRRRPAFPRPAWYHATATWTRPWKKSRSSGGAARQASSSSSCASK